MRMIINMYFTIINKNKCKYKRLHLGSENQLNEDRVRFNLTAKSPQRGSRVMKSLLSDIGVTLMPMEE